MKSRSAPARFGIVIYEGVEPIDIGGTAGVVSMARRVLPNVESVLIARDAGPVRLAGGVTVLAEYGFASAPECDVAIVCGGPGWPDAARDSRMLDYLRAQSPKQVASVCTGALILAAAGALEGRAATTRRRAVGQEALSPLALLGRTAGLEVLAVPVVDDIVVTGGGVSMAIDATLYLLGRLYGEAAAAEIAHVIEYDRAYAANKAGLGAHVVTARAAADQPSG